MEIKEYKQSDRDKLISILRKNTPAFFALEEEDEFSLYLKNEIEHYFVVVINGRIVGNGGFNYLKKENIARISWDMIDPECQGQGIGRFLLESRLKLVKKYYPKADIEVRTSQHVYPFYEKGGFTLVEVVNDYWAKGFDLYRMRIIG